MSPAVRALVVALGAASAVTSIALYGCGSFSADDSALPEAGIASDGGPLAFGYAKSFGPGEGGATFFVGDLAVKPTGEAFVVGTFVNNSINILGTPLPVPAGKDAFLVELGADGTPVFVRSSTMPKDQLGASVAIHDEQILQGTTFSGDYDDQDSGAIAAPSGPLAVAVARIESKVITGELALSGDGTDQLRALGVSDEGEVVAFGEFDHTMTLSRVLPPAGGTNSMLVNAGDQGPGIFIARMFRPGTNLETLHGFCLMSAHCFANAMDVSPLGEAVITGRFSGTVSFDSVGQFASSDDDAYVVRIDTGSSATWATVFGGDGVQESLAVALVPGSNDVVVAGTFAPQVTVPKTGEILMSKGAADVYVSRLDGMGKPVWTKSFGGIAADGVNSVAVDKQGNIFLVGTFKSPTIDFGGPTLVNASKSSSVATNDIFLAWLGPDGAHVYSARFGGVEDDTVTRVRVDGKGNVLLAGTFTGTIDFGGGPLAGGAMPNGYVVKLTRAP